MCFADSECLTDERERQGGLVTSSNIESSSWEKGKKSVSFYLCKFVCVREKVYAGVSAKQVTDDHYRLRHIPLDISPCCTFGQWDVYIDRSRWANHRQGESLGQLSARMLIPYLHINSCILVFEEVTEQSDASVRSKERLLPRLFH